MTTQIAEHTMEIRFKYLFKQYEYRVHTLALTLTKSDQFAKDIVQNVFMKLWECRRQMYTISNMEDWLYRQTESRVIDFLCRTAEDKKLRVALWTNMQRNLSDAEETDSLRDYGRIMEEAINHLPPQRIRVYRLSRLHGLNYNQVAEAPDNSRHNFKHKIFSAVQSVRKFFLLL